jgi:hypothetical protein
MKVLMYKQEPLAMSSSSTYSPQDSESVDHLKFVFMEGLVYKQEPLASDQLSSTLAKVMKANPDFSIAEAVVYMFDRYTFYYEDLVESIDGPYIPYSLPVNVVILTPLDVISRFFIR